MQRVLGCAGQRCTALGSQVIMAGVLPGRAPMRSGRFVTQVAKGTANAQVKVVDTGAAVLAAMRTAVFDIILLDIHMPEVRSASRAHRQCEL
jgi:CheY-like chemotaxis protein